LKKTVRIVSNDPNNSTTYLRVEATIKFEVGIEQASLNLHNIRKNGRTVKSAFVEVYQGVKYEVSEITTTSELISVRQVTPDDSIKKARQIEFEISVGPGLETGLLSESVSISFKNDARAKAQYFLYGIVVDDIEVTPLRLTYVINSSTIDPKNQTRKLTVVNYQEELPLELIDVSSVGDYLALEVKTVEEGQKFEISAVATEKVLVVDSVLNNDITITTNNPEMRMIKVPYRVKRMQ
jgi:hypothetical protein